MQYYPWIVNLELTNACNLECIFCNHRELKKSMKIKSLDEAILRNILSEITRWKRDIKCYELGLVGLGEPTIDDQLFDHLQIINEFSNKFQRISLNTNAVNLDKNIILLLLQSPINAITFSLNASNKTNYINLMGRDFFEQVIRNLDLFFQTLNDTPNKDISASIQLIDSQNNQLDEFFDLLPHLKNSKNVNVFIRKVYRKPSIDRANNLINIYRSGEPEIYPCWDIYTRLYIDVNGFMYPCTIGNDCYRESSNLCLGNVQNQSLLHLFNSSKIKNARSDAQKGKLAFPECKDCNIWSLTPNNFIWNHGDQSWMIKEKTIRAYGLKG